MEILLLALLAVAGIPAAVMVCMLAGQGVGGVVNCVSDVISFLRKRRRAGA